MSISALRWLISLLWLLVVAVSVLFNFSQIDETAFQMAVTEGRTSWIKDQSYRQWVTEKGGIYAVPSEKYPANPYLSHIPDRDVTTTEGKKLTLINPAYMIRQVHEISVLPDAPKEHITSLHPLRPENKADAWETATLQAFERGEEEIAELAEIDGKPYMRYMRPMITNEGCLKCHAHQGYRVGDIRGGVSFSIPFAPFQEAADEQKRSLLLWHALIALIGIAGIWFTFGRIQRDRTLLRQALSESREVSLKNSLLLSSMGEGVFGIDREGRCTFINDTALSILGYTQNEVLGFDTHALFHHHAYVNGPIPKEECTIHRAIAAGESRSVEEWFIRKDGRFFPALVSIAPIRTEEGETEGGVVVFQDITKRKEDENAIRRLNETLEERVREEVDKSRQKDLLLIQQSRLASMGEMIHNIAHQWRQPLNTLAVILANIEDDYKYNELTAESLSRAVTKTKKILSQMSQTIDDFRDFFRSDKEATPFDVADVIEEALIIIDASLSNNNITLVKQYSRPLPCYGYPNQFSQAVLNLLTNAKEAIRERRESGGEIRIEAYRDAHGLVVRISDDAGGFDPAVLPRIFDPYFTTKDSGTGIGLYMARMIIERNHNGTITADNTPKGARITITIPQTDDAPLPKETP